MVGDTARVHKRCIFYTHFLLISFRPLWALPYFMPIIFEVVGFRRCRLLQQRMSGAKTSAGGSARRGQGFYQGSGGGLSAKAVPLSMTA